MTSSDLVPTSRRLRSATYAEFARLTRELERRRRRLSQLQEDTASEQSAIQEIESRLAALAPFADQWDEPKASSVYASPNGAGEAESDLKPVHLRGSEIRIAAVQSLLAVGESAAPIHYRDWFEIFCNAGNAIDSADPEASFLTQLGRSPLVRRTSDRGIYALDLDVPRRLRERLHELHRELAALHDGQQTIDEITSIATRRTELTRAVVAAEGELQEVLVSLADRIL